MPCICKFLIVVVGGLFKESHTPLSAHMSLRHVADIRKTLLELVKRKYKFKTAFNSP